MVGDFQGNVDYKNSKNKRSYGGSKRKLIKIIETDPKIKEILRQISEYRESKW